MNGKPMLRNVAAPITKALEGFLIATPARGGCALA